MSNKIDYFDIVEKFKLYDDIITELECIKNSAELEDIEKIINTVKDNNKCYDLLNDLYKLQLNINKLISNSEFNATKEIITRLIDVYKNAIIILNKQVNLIAELNNISQYKNDCKDDECSETIKNILSEIETNFNLISAGKFKNCNRFFYRYINYPVPRDCTPNYTCWETKPLNVPSYKLFCKCPEDFKKSLDELCKNLNCVKNSYLGKIETAEMEISILNNDQNSRNSESNVIVCKEITHLKKKLNEIKCLGRKSFKKDSYDSLPDWLSI